MILNPNIITYLEHYQELHQNCSKEQEFSTALIEELKLQNQNLTKDLGNIASAKESLRDSISDEFKEEILFKASEIGDIDRVRLALELGANFNAKEGSTLRNPLHYVAINGNLEIGKFLLQNKADVNSKDTYGNTPLNYASKFGQLEVVKFLLENGADVNAINEYKWTPLHIAARFGHPKIVEILLSNGARKDVNDKNYFTPIEIAKTYRKGDYKQVIALLQDS